MKLLVFFVLFVFVLCLIHDVLVDSCNAQDEFEITKITVDDDELPDCSDAACLRPLIEYNGQTCSILCDSDEIEYEITGEL